MEQKVIVVVEKETVAAAKVMETAVIIVKNKSE